MKRSFLTTLILSVLLSSLGLASVQDAKKIHIIYSRSSHADYCHNNKEVAQLLKEMIGESALGEQFQVTTSHNYPQDLTLVEQADLIILSSDGGPSHALVNQQNITMHTQHLDSALQKSKAGLIVVHWATDAPSLKFGEHHEENAALMRKWIGAVYHWHERGQGMDSSWTWKYPVLELKVNQEHPISNGLPESYELQDEYYFNFFTEGAESRTPQTERVTFLHTAPAPNYAGQVREDKSTWRVQPTYWAYDREDGGRSVAMTSAHMYHTWANPHFFKSFMNSIFWTMNLPVPEGGVDLAPPTLERLVSVSSQVQIHTKALHFK